jgi:methionyl-tRNA synthetase
VSTRRLLVTSALPYANGHIHIGHLVEYIQTDIWVRFQRLRGHEVAYMCADDTHGTAIMIRAQKEGRSEESLIAEMREAHIRDFAGFDVEFDYYGSTNSEENRELCHEIWAALRKAGLVVEEDVRQLFDTAQGTFLADRFVKGTCPKCGAADQYGDNCDKCGATYTPADLINPRSTLSGTTPEFRTARHLFVRIEDLHPFLTEWTQSGTHLQPEVANYLKGHFLGEPLRDWDISRPAPYFGFEIPDSPGNYWYVWFDAPIGYIAATKAWCKKTGSDFDSWWKTGPAEVHHFIGKDITYFHTLFWPAMLKTAGFKLPTFVHIHGFLTVGGEKMSKSKGTFVRGSTYLEHLDPAFLRYYYATKLSKGLDDLDLNLKEFEEKVNSDLVGKVVNLASRSAKFVQETGLATVYPEDGGLFAEAAAARDEIASDYDAGDFSAAMRKIMALADKANRYIDEKSPWTLRKDPTKADEVRQVCTVALNLFRQLAVYLAPVLPRLANQAGELLQTPIRSWNDVATPLVGTGVSPFTHMLKRVDEKQVQAMIEASKEPEPVAAPAVSATGAPAAAVGAVTPGASTDVAATPVVDGPECLVAEPLAGVIAIDDFLKVDLRVVRVLAAEPVEKSKKLIRLTVSLGGDVRRTIFAGIKTAYDPATLVGRLIVVCVNLAPREMKGVGVSEGMVLAAGPGDKEIFILSPDSGAKPGQRLH